MEASVGAVVSFEVKCESIYGRRFPGILTGRADADAASGLEDHTKLVGKQNL